MFDVESVFAPGTLPTVTYVEREDVERKLRSAFRTQGMIASVSGPTKTGKTVLVERVATPDLQVSVSGARIKDAQSLWDLVGERLGLSGFGEGELVDTLIDEERVLVIDDFHYVDRPVQAEIARHLKDPAGRGLSVAVIAIPHRADDAIRGNPDLRGRVTEIDLDYWDEPTLARIADQGFPYLNIELSPEDRTRLATDCLGAPQLMQLSCLELCRYFRVDGHQADRLTLTLDEEAYAQITRTVAASTNSQSVFGVLKQGPAGRQRTQHVLRDGTSVDVYELILRALASDPPTLSFPMRVLRQRLAAVLKPSSPGPQGGSLGQAIRQMHKLLRDRMPTDRVLEWDEERQTLDLTDPYFAYYLRHGVGTRSTAEPN